MAKFVKKIALVFLFSLILPLIVIFVLWYFQNLRIGSPLILPSAFAVFARLKILVQTQVFWLHCGSTALRSISSFFISLVFSVFLGTLAGRFIPFKQFLSFPLAIIKSAPVVSFILLAVFWFSTNMVPVFIGVLMTLPIMSGAIISGIQNVDTKLLAMAQIYGFTPFQKLQHIYKPSVLPYFFSGCLTAFSLSWKVVVAAEVLSLPLHGIGTALYRSKVHIETADVFAYTITMITLTYVLELGLSFFLKQKRAK